MLEASLENGEVGDDYRQICLEELLRNSDDNVLGTSENTKYLNLFSSE